jgi:hypothetical protein
MEGCEMKQRGHCLGALAVAVTLSGMVGADAGAAGYRDPGWFDLYGHHRSDTDYKIHAHGGMPPRVHPGHYPIVSHRPPTGWPHTTVLVPVGPIDGAGMMAAPEPGPARTGTWELAIPDHRDYVKERTPVGVIVRLRSLGNDTAAGRTEYIDVPTTLGIRLIERFPRSTAREIRASG